MWRILCKNGVRTWIATAIVPLFLLFGAGWEDSLWGIMIAFSGALFANLLTVWLCDVPSISRGRRLAAWCSAIYALGSGCVGLTGVFMAGAISWKKRGRQDAMLMSIPPTFVYAIWFAFFGKTSGTGLTEEVVSGLYQQIPAFALRCLITPFEDLTGSPILGGILFALVIGTTVWRLRVLWQQSATIVLMAVGAVFLTLTVAYGHVNGGNPSSSRYADVTLTLVLPLAAVLLNELHARTIVAVGLAATIAAGVNGGVVLVREASALHSIESRLRARALFAATSTDPAILPDAMPDPASMPGVTVEQLRELRAAGDLPTSTPDNNVNPDLLALLHVVVSGTRPADQQSETPTVVDGQMTAVSKTCLRSSTNGQRVAVQATQAGWFELSVGSPTSFDLFVRLASHPNALQYVTTLYLTPSQLTYVEISQPGLTLVLDGVSDGTSVCGQARK